jgi:hypothetical protein
MTSSTCRPQQVQVVLLQREQITGWHTVSPLWAACTPLSHIPRGVCKYPPGYVELAGKLLGFDVVPPSRIADAEKWSQHALLLNECSRLLKLTLLMHPNKTISASDFIGHFSGDQPLGSALRKVIDHSSMVRPVFRHASMPPCSSTTSV